MIKGKDGCTCYDETTRSCPIHTVIIDGGQDCTCGKCRDCQIASLKSQLAAEVKRREELQDELKLSEDRQHARRRENKKLVERAEAAEQQHMMDSECIERIRNNAMNLELERDDLRASLADAESRLKEYEAREAVLVGGIKRLVAEQYRILDEEGYPVKFRADYGGIVNLLNIVEQLPARSAQVQRVLDAAREWVDYNGWLRDTILYFEAPTQHPDIKLVKAVRELTGRQREE